VYKFGWYGSFSQKGLSSKDYDLEEILGEVYNVKKINQREAHGLLAGLFNYFKLERYFILLAR